MQDYSTLCSYADHQSFSNLESLATALKSQSEIEQARKNLELQRRAKTAIEIGRLRVACANKFVTSMQSLTPEIGYPKNDVLMGIRQAIEHPSKLSEQSSLSFLPSPSCAL